MQCRDDTSSREGGRVAVEFSLLLQSSRDRVLLYHLGGEQEEGLVGRSRAAGRRTDSHAHQLP